jgi:hypothetical protein
MSTFLRREAKIFLENTEYGIPPVSLYLDSISTCVADNLEFLSKSCAPIVTSPSFMINAFTNCF